MMENQSTPQEAWATIPEAGARLGLNRTRSYELFTSGRLPGAVRISPRCWRVHIPTLENHLLEKQAKQVPA